jgi:prophage tail gpP-like protein
MPIKKQYTVKDGDTVSGIAKSNNLSTLQIVTANPQVFTAGRIKKSQELIGGDYDLIYPGDILNILSSVVDTFKKAQVLKVDSEDELNIFIDDKKCPLPHEFELTQHFGSCSDSFSFSYPYSKDLKNPAYSVNIDDFKTKGLPKVRIHIGKDPALTGDIEVPSNIVTPSASIQSLAGRSATYPLEKSDILPAIEREYLNQSLEQLTSIICNAYSVDFEIDLAAKDQVVQTFVKVTIEDNEKPFMFLSRLCRERGLIADKTGSGNFLIRKPVLKEPVAHFVIDSEFITFLGVEQLEFTFDTREIYGQYIGKTTTPDDANLEAVVQSKTLSQQTVKITDYNDATESNIKSVTEWEEQKAIKNLYKNSIPFPSWLNPNSGKKWNVEDYITLEFPLSGSEPKLMMVSTIIFNRPSSEKKTAVLSLIPADSVI